LGDNHRPVLITENNFGLLTPIRPAQGFSARLRDDFQSASLTCSHHVPQASLTIYTDLLVLFIAFSRFTGRYRFTDYATIQFDRQQQARDNDVMSSSYLTLGSIPLASDSQIIRAVSLSLNLPQPPKKFYRHGWQSWALTTWLDPGEPPQPVRAPEFRAKDEDPGYALHNHHISAWVGAVELGDEDILLLGALDLSGRVELDGFTLKGFYEDGQDSQWLLVRGKEDEVFSKYVAFLETKFGKGRFVTPPRVWSSWYSLYRWINEPILLRALKDFCDMPFDVFQIDDGWQLAHGDWESNRKFPSGMKVIAEKISETERTPGLWLAPFMVSTNSQLANNHPDWLLRDEKGTPVRAGITWTGNPYCLDSSHPNVLEWLDQLMRKIRSWGYDYLKLDFLYIGALMGKRYKNIPREAAYRNAMEVIRNAAGDAYILACGAPILPSLGLCDGLRVGPDVAPFWLNTPLTVWLNNPNDTSAQNGVRTSIHRLWLRPIVNVDPDVSFFCSKYNSLKLHEKQFLQDLGTISGFKATSDLPQWLNASEKRNLRKFFESARVVQKRKRYEFQIDRHIADFNPVIPLQTSQSNIPIWLAKNLGLLKIGIYQALPAIWERIKN
jgi:alpha-galactosidase